MRWLIAGQLPTVTTIPRASSATIVVDDNAAVVTGFYTFTRMLDGKPVPGPSRFTMLVTRRGNEWRIAHHHSSPHVLPKN
jgi:hypothetical protein